MRFNKSFCLKLIFVAAAALMVFPQMTYAVGRGSWMTGLPDARTIGTLVIPATHASGSYRLKGALGETQDWDITEQLQNGIRFLDLRIAGAGPDKRYAFEVHNGSDKLGDLQTRVLDAVNRFLDSNPGEVILVSVMQEEATKYLPKNIPLNAGRFLKEVVRARGSKFHLKAVSAQTTLGEVRGKIVLFDRLGGALGEASIKWKGPDLPETAIHDISELNELEGARTGSNAYRLKAEKVREHLHKARADQGKRLWINHASASWNGAFIGNNAEVVNREVKSFIEASLGENFGSIILMAYPNRNGGEVITSIISFNHSSGKKPPAS